jgi:hypothetical protein
MTVRRTGTQRVNEEGVAGRGHRQRKPWEGDKKG